jgi:hypothetical protein
MLLERKGVVVDSCQGLKKERTMINHKPNNYDLDYKGPNSLNKLLWAMVVICMNPMPPNVIGRKACL